MSGAGSPPVHAHPASDRVRVRRKPARGRYDRDSIDAILDEAVFGTVSCVADGLPVAVPMVIWRRADRVYLHGAPASRVMTAVASGDPICLSVTLLDGYVLATTGFNHSVNYRSVTVYGRATALATDNEKLDALEALVERRHPGRWAQLRPVTPSELLATQIAWLPLEEASAKIRAEGAYSAPGDETWPVWSGVVPIRYGYDEPVPDARVRPGVRAPLDYQEAAGGGRPLGAPR